MKDERISEDYVVSDNLSEHLNTDMFYYLHTKITAFSTPTTE